MKKFLILLLSILTMAALNAFVTGADVSSLPSLERSGVVFHDKEGNEADLVELLAENGVQCIRVRIWVDPYDQDGNGYGGGNCDLDNAIEIGRMAKAQNIGLLVDFHYSDFWADPSRQTLPKAWKGQTKEELTQTIYNYTYDSLKQLKDNGIIIDYVQIGNEINNGICGQNGLESSCELLESASKAVKEAVPEAKVVVHFTDPGSFDFGWAAKVLEKGGVDYDVFATSYYPYWHGSLEALKTNLKTITENYGKQVMIAETSYPYTDRDTDGHPESVTVKDASVQRQMVMFLDLSKAMETFGDSYEGIFYWEPAWICVPAEDQNSRKAVWEMFGSGWATSYAAGYDGQAARYHGGSATDTQALFDEEGCALESVSMFSLVHSWM